MTRAPPMWIVLTLRVAACVPAPAMAAPVDLPALTVTLADGVRCPAPAQAAPLLQMPVGCVAPWGGVLYTDAEHQRVREGVARSARLVLELRTERDRAYAAHDDLRRSVLPRLDTIAARLDSLADVPESLAGLHRAMPPPDDGWPAGVYVATGAAGALAGGLGCAAGLDGEAAVAGCAAGGVVVAALATWGVQVLVGWLR